ncbi:MAG TPA: autotransporter-associated beta strand repeat-containing protein, partial [Stellaceae bacterium]|nr:autotransporter-associated beta strand repeat-containing protein [Stellaceae bacterium]
FDGVIGGAGGITQKGGGTMSLSAVQEYTGATIIASGTLAVGNAGSIAASSGVSLTSATAVFDPFSSQTIQGLSGVAGSKVTIGSGKTLTLGAADSTIFDGIISGTGSAIVKQGAGTLAFAGANTYTGATSIQGGTLALSGTGSVATSSGVADAGTFDISQTSSGATITTLSGAGSVALGGQALTLSNASATFSGIIADGGLGGGNGGSLVMTGGTLTLSGVNTYTGATTVTAGTLALGNTAAVADSSGVNLAGSGTTLDIGNAGGSTKVSSLSGVAGSIVNLGANQFVVGGSGAATTFAGVIQGTGSLFELPSNTLTLTGVNTYTGGTSITSGTLAIGAGGSIAASSGVVFLDNGILDISNGGNQTIGDLSDTAGDGAKVVLGANTLTLGTANSTNFSGVTSGTGGVTKQGTGTLALGGVNTFSGALTINGGTVAMGPFASLSSASVNLNASGTIFDVSALPNASIQDLSGVAGSTVSLGGQTLTAGAANSTSFAGIIADGGIGGGTGGSLIKQGAGTLTLSGANTYTGATTINAGTLALGNTAAIADSSGLTLAASGTTFDISNAGGSTKVSALSGVGGSVVNLGANQLVVGGGGAATTFAGVIQGTGSLFELPSNTLTLTGANTYTGGTMITSGTLAIGAGGSLAATGAVGFLDSGIFDISNGGNQTIGDLSGIPGTVVLGANTLTLGTADSTSFGGVISGTGGLTKQGAGTLALAGVDTFSGTVTINAGTVAIGPFGSISSASVNLAASGTSFDVSAPIGPVIQNLSGVGGSTVSVGTQTLSFGTAASTTFAGSFTGSGGLTWQGTGTLSLTGNSNGFSGTTAITAGTVALGTDSAPGASLGGNILVVGGMLKGFGTIGGNLSNNAGTVAPGGSIGTLTVGGNYTQGGGGTLSIEVSPAAASQLKVGGAATLNGALALLFDPGTYAPASYKILTASAVSGTFSTVTGTNPSGIAQSVLYDPADVTLTLGAASIAPVIVAPTNDTIYTAVTSTAILTAQQMNGIILDRVGARAAGIADGQVAALGGAGMPVHVAQSGNVAALGDVASALPQVLGSDGGWFRGVGGFASINGSASAPGFTSSTGGFLGGYDRPVGPNVYLGVAGGYLHSAVGEHSTSNGTEDSARFAVYGGALLGPSLLSGTAGYAHDWLNTQRGITGIGTASESHGADEATAAAQWSLPQPIRGLSGGVATLTPKVGLQFVHLSEAAFADTGASGFDLSAGGHGTDSLQPYIGAALSQKMTSESGTVITPELRLGYAYEALSNARLLTVTTASGASFPVTGVAPSRSQVTAGIGLTMTAGPNMSLYADYDALLPTGNITSQTVQAGFRWRF